MDLGLILGILGLFGWTALVASGRELLWKFYGLVGREETVQKGVQKVAGRRSHPFGKEVDVSTFGREVKVHWFVDFLSAVCDPADRRLLDRWLARWIRLKVGRKKPTRVAVPKLGNVILASTVARRLRVPLVVVRQQGLREFRIDDPFEGEVARGDRVLLIDDVASDCDFLTQCVDRLQEKYAQVVAILVLVHRAEGACIEEFARREIPYHPVLELDDAAIKVLREP